MKEPVAQLKLIFPCSPSLDKSLKRALNIYKDRVLPKNTVLSQEYLFIPSFLASISLSHKKEYFNGRCPRCERKWIRCQNTDYLAEKALDKESIAEPVILRCEGCFMCKPELPPSANSLILTNLHTRRRKLI